MKQSSSVLICEIFIVADPGFQVGGRQNLNLAEVV